MSKCCICKKIIHLDCESYYWNECWVCNKLLCKDCVDEDKNKIYIGLDVISYGWYVADDAFENMFCDECFKIKLK